MMSVVLVSCGQSAGTVSEPASTPPADQAREELVTVDENVTRVVFLGDSLTAGYGLQTEDALPARIEAIWRADGLDAVAVNAGVSGDTTSNGLARFDWSVTTAEPDLLVIALGANDYLMGVPADVAKSNLAAILEKAEAANLPVVLVGLAVRGNVQADTREADYAAIYPALAAEYDVPYYESLLGAISDDPSMLQSDGLHPTKEGVERIAAPLAAFLETQLPVEGAP